MSPRKPDPNQIELDFCERIECYADYGREILERAAQVPEPPNDGRETEAEFYIGLAAACKTAIDEAGLSRVQVIDAINAHFGRSGMVGADPRVRPPEAEGQAHRSAPTGAEGETRLTPHAKPKTLNMLNNYLSKPTENRLPIWIVQGICLVTGSCGPLEYLAKGLGCTIISAEERAELVLGKLDQHIREGVSLKRQLQRELGGRMTGKMPVPPEGRNDKRVG